MTKTTNGLLRLPVIIDDESLSNPKDPPYILLALLDGGANCNLISNSRARSLQISPQKEEGKIQFGNSSDDTITESLWLRITAKYEEIKFTFEAKFLICSCSEDLLLGRPTLNSTGLIHLYITDEVSPNPFSCNTVNSNVIIEILDDSVGELDEVSEVSAGPAFLEETQNLWIIYSSSLGIP